MKYYEGDKVKIKSLDWYNENKNENGDVELKELDFVSHMSVFCGKTFEIAYVYANCYIVKEACAKKLCWTDEMIEGLAEDGTPKFKVNDIVFVKNIGWVRITNSYWDCPAAEYIYEAIVVDGEVEYDNINQSNIECQIPPES